VRFTTYCTTDIFEIETVKDLIQQDVVMAIKPMRGLTAAANVLV
jgi:hypothetical protein